MTKPTPHEAAQKALEALENERKMSDGWVSVGEHKAIEALRSARAQQGEPVAWPSKITDAMQAAGQCAWMTSDGVDPCRVFWAMLAAAPAAQQPTDDYKSWYDEAMCASNEAGFVGLSAAQTIRELNSMLASTPQAPQQGEPVAGGVLHRTGKLYALCDTQPDAEAYRTQACKIDDGVALRVAPLYVGAAPAPHPDTHSEIADQLVAWASRIDEQNTLICNTRTVVQQMVRSLFLATPNFGYEDSYRAAIAAGQKLLKELV